MPYTVQIIECYGEAILPIPGELIQQLGLQDGDQLDVTVENGVVILKPFKSR